MFNEQKFMKNNCLGKVRRYTNYALIVVSYHFRKIHIILTKLGSISLFANNVLYI